MGLKFRPFVDAVCRKCEAYFKDFKGKHCPCCKQNVARHAKKGKSLKNRLFTAFADFWRFILREKKQYDLKHEMRIKKNAGKRTCLLCDSSETYTTGKTKTPMWTRYMHGHICGKCYSKKYREIKMKKLEIQRCN